MAKKLLNIISSGLAAEQTLELIKQRKSGQLKSLRSCWPKFDAHLLKGID